MNKRRLDMYKNDKNVSISFNWWLVFTVFYTEETVVDLYLIQTVSVPHHSRHKWVGSQQNSIGTLLGHNTSCQTYTSGNSSPNSRSDSSAPHEKAYSSSLLCSARLL